MQYLFDWRLFILEKCPNFPARLCFPQFYYMSIYSVIIHYNRLHRIKEQFLTLIEEYFKDLENIVNTIFPDKHISLITVDEMMRKIKEYHDDTNIFYLEDFIDSEEGRCAYQEALLKESKRYYDKDCITDIVTYLHDRRCCLDKESTCDLPHSKHYVTLFTNNSLPMKNFGPQIWGPYYWKIFHYLPENCDIYNEKMLQMLNNFVLIIPVIIPCEECRGNYYVNISPHTLPEIKSKDEAIALYDKVHSKVSLHTAMPGL